MTFFNKKQTKRQDSKKIIVKWTGAIIGCKIIQSKHVLLLLCFFFYLSLGSVLERWNNQQLSASI